MPASDPFPVTTSRVAHFEALLPPLDVPPCGARRDAQTKAAGSQATQFPPVPGAGDDPYPLSEEDVAQAMAEWARTGDDWFAHAYDLTLRAERCGERIAALCSAERLPRRVLGHLRALAHRYERAALMAQAHQSYVLAVALRKGRQPGTEHDPDNFRPEARLMDRAHLLLFRRINIAHGHGAIYRQP